MQLAMQIEVACKNRDFIESSKIARSIHILTIYTRQDVQCIEFGMRLGLGDYTATIVDFELYHEQPIQRDVDGIGINFQFIFVLRASYQIRNASMLCLTILAIWGCVLARAKPSTQRRACRASPERKKSGQVRSTHPPHGKKSLSSNFFFSLLFNAILKPINALKSDLVSFQLFYIKHLLSVEEPRARPTSFGHGAINHPSFFRHHYIPVPHN